MKKFLLVIVSLFCINLSLYGQSSFDEALMRAKIEKKLLLVELIMDFCPYCERMEKSVLSKDDVKKILDEKYIFIKLNTKRDEIPSNLTSRLTPTFYFLNHQGEVLEELKGLMKKSDFLFYLEEIYTQEIK
jgi:thioredoxin-related protein